MFSINATKQYLNDHLMNLILVLIFILFIFSYGSGNVSAAGGDTIYVNIHGNDSWNGQSSVWNGHSGPKLSIRNATGDVNRGGTVKIANGQYYGDKNTRIIINKNMKIIGESKTGTIINGNNKNWIFLIKPGINVNINNLVLINGRSSKAGGSINNYGTLIVTNSTFRSNRAYGGGAISNYIHANLIVKGCTFTDNKATFGGAVENGGKMIATRSAFKGNKAVSGGAIDNADILTVTESKFINNHASEGGGAIANYEGYLTLHFNQIVGNTAPWGSAILHGLGRADLALNWWGSNKGPLNDVAGTKKLGPWLVLYLSANPKLIEHNGKSNINADLVHDSNKVSHNPLSGHVPGGIVVKFKTTQGTINSTVSIINGVSHAILRASIVDGVAVISASVDHQTVSTSVRINSAPRITNIYPLNNSMKVPPNKSIRITFSEPIKSGNMHIELQKMNKKPISITSTIIGNILTIKHPPLTNGKYTLRLYNGCITDLGGLSLKNLIMTFKVHKTKVKPSHGKFKLLISYLRSSQKDSKYLENIISIRNWINIFFKFLLI